MKREPALPKCLFMLPTTLRAQIEANKLPLRQRSLPAMPTPIALASWNGIPPRCARGRAPILALAVIACSLLWAGSAPAGPNLQPDEAVAVSPEEQPDAMSWTKYNNYHLEALLQQNVPPREFLLPQNVTYNQPEDGGDPAEETEAEEEVEVGDDDDFEDMEWDSDESDDEGDVAIPGTAADDTTQQQQRGKPQSQQQPQQKRQAGHGSQRVKNKQRKSDVKREMQAGEINQTGCRGKQLSDGSKGESNPLPRDQPPILRPPRKPVYLMRHHNLDKIPPPNQHVTLEAKRKLRPTKIIAKGKLPIHTYNPQIGDHGKQRPLATLSNLVMNYERLPHRHVRRELERVHAMLEGNAIDAVTFACLATEEGGIATMGEAIQVAHQATQRCSNYMDELVQWLQERFNYDQPGSRRRKQWSAPAGATKTQTSGKGPRPATDVHWTKRALSPRPPKNCAANLVYLDSVVELAMHRRIVLYLFLLEPLTEPTQHHVQYQVSVEDKRPCGAVREAAPYQILRAQHIIERLMPFLEQEAAATLQDAHSMLFQWTTALWGEPITLADEGHGADTGGNLPPTQEQLHMAEDGDSAVDTEAEIPVPDRVPVVDLSQEDDGFHDGQERLHAEMTGVRADSGQQDIRVTALESTCREHTELHTSTLLRVAELKRQVKDLREGKKISPVLRSGDTAPSPHDRSPRSPRGDRDPEEDLQM
ncbi:hypothetical protein AK812_SmicGene34947 [Symbiodinium microadriaticum]|uniref:Uncharacterized protein n=1 Tax=Symbiodinium microadriaticum TaxID=2951 RepID=A0A1Q9CMQ2_SYMMI|nr:hypothetical protein AK812_SmicGene34947 [Symbiodinium microadriaticum]